ncbi:MAG: hypothetical protein HYZ16_08760 [Bacteroidetes bacterium]|jgi:hypothetical protein|nr:hypothetical protein [Bacteroidota bacterium]
MQMFRPFLFLFCWWMAAACANRQPTLEYSLPPDHPALGHWIAKSYTDSVRQLESTQAAANLLSGITEFHVSIDSVRWVFGNSERKSSPIAFLGSDHLVSNGIALYWNKVQGYVGVAHKKSMGLFARSPVVQGHFTGLEQFIINNLLAGTYHLAPNGTSAAIGTNGMVQGLKGMASIKPILLAQELGNFDILQITDEEGNTSFKGWGWVGDTLVIYHLIPGQDYTYGRGRIWLRLVITEGIG